MSAGPAQVLPSVFADTLKRTMGLDVATIGPAAIKNAVRQRMAACMLSDVAAYEQHLLASEPELQALIEASVVPETWFFRDAQAFVEMVRAFGALSSDAAAANTIRLLSLPCSTGEEPYSIAMALLDAGAPSSRFRIDAVDISASALAYAQRAVYGKNSFRGKNLEFRERYFERCASGRRLSDAVRECVHFTQGNIVAPDFMPQAGIYDAIFCRNLLVYFDRLTQTRAIATLRRLLADDGIVFVGPAEAGMMFGHGFVWSKTPLAFAFRKQRPGLVTAPEGPTLVTAGKGARLSPTTRLQRPVLKLPAAQPPVAPLRVAALPLVNLADAAALADAGRFDEAEELCNADIRAHGSSAPAFYLKGLISNAAGRAAEAVQFYRKALYLDSRHVGSLVHLSLLLEKRGEATGARVLRERLQRLERSDAGAER